MKRRYWFADPEDLKKKYLKALPFLSLKNVEVHSVQSPEFVKVESELNDTKKRLKRLEKYFDEREGLDNLKKPEF
jgi:hypothetical protein